MLGIPGIAAQERIGPTLLGKMLATAGLPNSLLLLGRCCEALARFDDRAEDCSACPAIALEFAELTDGCDEEGT